MSHLGLSSLCGVRSCQLVTSIIFISLLTSGHVFPGRPVSPLMTFLLGSLPNASDILKSSLQRGFQTGSILISIYSTTKMSNTFSDRVLPCSSGGQSRTVAIACVVLGPLESP